MFMIASKNGLNHVLTNNNFDQSFPELWMNMHDYTDEKENAIKHLLCYEKASGIYTCKMISSKVKVYLSYNCFSIIYIVSGEAETIYLILYDNLLYHVFELSMRMVHDVIFLFLYIMESCLYQVPDETTLGVVAESFALIQCPWQFNPLPVGPHYTRAYLN